MSKRKKLIIFIISALVFLVASISTFAAIISLSVRGEVEATTTTLTAEATYTSSTSNYSFTFTEPGDNKYIETSVLNNTNTDSLHVYHEITTRSGNNDLLDAILVYYNEEYVDTLSSIISNHKPISNEYMLVAPGKTISDKITFELHNSAIDGLFDHKSCNLTITTYTENMDYSKYILVTNEEEFVKAITDINSGYLDVTPTIVLGNSINVTSALTFTEPVIIQTNGYNLSGSFTLNDDNTSNSNALVTILGDGTVSAITLGANYDALGAKALVKEYILNKTKNGIVSNTPVNILGPYGFYGINITTDSITSYTSPNLSANVAYTTMSRITLAGDTSFDVKVLGTAMAIVEANLSHLPSTNEIISSNLFLPTSIPSENATIEWKSSNEAIMSSSGKIVALGKVDSVDGEITLSATIKVNNTVTTKSYTFKVSSHSNEVNFQKLIQEMSPLIITVVDDGTNNTRYYMPTVGTNTLSTHDYRRNYTILANSDPLFTWNAYPNIDLVSLDYSMTKDQASKYDYITVDENKVYLSKNTLSNYAKITVTGEFSDGEICTSVLNISIVLGSDTQLLEKAFTSVDKALNDISILGNILKTRGTSGIINEKGDFILPSTYGTNYTISYACDSEIITRIDPVVEDNITTGYKFIVNPLKFNSSETSIPIYVTVTYVREEGDPITKEKTIYIDAPAAIHYSDCGSISIFNSLKYQTFTSIGATTNNGFNTSNGLVTDNGYDYLLIRDIIGDSAYLSDYRVKNTYLTMNNITEANYQAPVTNIKLYTASTNNTSTTDTAAYDFVKLIEWATGNTKVTAGSVVSQSSATALGALSSYKSNGEVYLTLNEVAVIEEFYKHYTLDDGTLWNSLKSQAMETAPGYIYDNVALIEAVLNSLVTEIGTDSNWWENTNNSTYGKIYAKYLEIINRYAITTSKNEEPMSPAQEVYNSKFTYNISTTKTYQNPGTTNASIPAKILVDGVYVDGYWNRSAEPNWHSRPSGNNQGTYAQPAYYSDKTKYITEPELTVLKAFWLGAISRRTQNNNANTDIAATENVLKEFGHDSIVKIQQALAAVDGELPYPDYDISDFTYYGQALINCFNACLVVPTYLSSNGINLLIESFYNNFNETGYKLKEYGSTTNSPFVSTLVNDVPAVTNLDNLEGGLSYFKYLTSLDIKGNANLYAFLGDYGLSQAFARITLTNSSLTSLTMQYVSPEWNTFDLTNIRNLDALSILDVSNNLGIKSVTPLLHSKRGSYTSVNFYNIGEVYEYNAFVIDNLSYSCDVIYSDSSNVSTTKNKVSGNASVLINTSDIGDFVSEHLYLTNVIYDDEGNQKNVCWRVEQGNDIYGTEITTGTELEEIDSVRAMNMRISPYYYCNTTFTLEDTTFTFTAGNLYKITVQNNVLHAEQINVVNGNTFEVELRDSLPATNLDEIAAKPDTDPNMIVHDPALTHDGESSHTTVETGVRSGKIYEQNTSILGSTTTYQIYMYFYVFYFQARTGSNTGTAQNYYLRSNGEELTANTNAVASDCYMAVLTETQAKFIDYLKTNDNGITDAKLRNEFGITPVGNYIYLGIQNLNSAVNNCYVFNVRNQMFLCDSGFRNELGSKIQLGYSNPNFTFTSDTGKRLSGFRGHIVSGNNHLDIISAVFTNQNSTSDLTSTGSNTNQYNKNWRKYSSSSTTQFSNSNSVWNVEVSENIPSLTIQTAEGNKYTVTFNCYTIRNARYAVNSNSRLPTVTDRNTGTVGSCGYVYDNGATLLLDRSPSNPTGGTFNAQQPTGYDHYFILLTDAEYTRLMNWYSNPTSNINIGNTVERVYGNSYTYYIYNPFTKRFVVGESTNNTGKVYMTSVNKPANPFELTYGHIDNETAHDGQNNVSVRGTGFFIAYHNHGATINNNGVFSNGTGISWNAYGGINQSYAIAGWSCDTGSLWVFDEVQEANQYTYEYQEPAVVQSYNAYKLTYSTNRVQAHILRKNIEKEYELNKFYYLSEDITLNGITYKAGNVIRFVYNAYYGYDYEADIEYYETIFTYYDSSNGSHDLPIITSMDYEYYPIEDTGYTGEINFVKIVDPNNYFNTYDSGFTYTNDSGAHTVTYPETTRWIYTVDAFNELKNTGVLYADEYGKELGALDTFNPAATYYKREYQQENIFNYEFDLNKDHLYIQNQNGYQSASSATFNNAITYYEKGYTPMNLVTRDNFELYKSTLYLDQNGTPVPIYATYNANQTYYTVANYYPVTFQTEEQFNNAKISYPIYTDNVGTPLAFDASYVSSSQVYYLKGQGGYSVASVNASNFESLKAKLYLDNQGTPVGNNAYDANQIYYERVYQVAVGVNASNFSMLVHTLYNDNLGNIVLDNAGFDYDTLYYVDAFVESNFINDTFNKYRTRLYLDNQGSPIDLEAVYDRTRQYYMDVYEVASNINALNFNTYKAYLYSNPYGDVLDSNATFDGSMTYYKKKHTIAQPEPTGNTTPAWYELEKYIVRLYSHTKLADEESILNYKEDYTHVYNGVSGYPKIYKYVGTGSENIYANPTLSSTTTIVDDATIVTFYASEHLERQNVSYLTNYGYYFIMDNVTYILDWDTNNQSNLTNTAETMDQIIQNANLDFNTNNYNTWYGKHYAYNGFTMESSFVLDRAGYDKGYVYRIVENETKSGFIWERVYPYFRKAGAQMVTEASTGEAAVGDTIWATSECFGGFYTGGVFYRIVRDDFTKTLNVIQFTDVTLTNHTNYTDLQNKKIRYIYQGDYLGYAGTYELIISAVIRDPNGDGNHMDDEVKTYKIKFVGTVIW